MKGSLFNNHRVRLAVNVMLSDVSFQLTKDGSKHLSDWKSFENHPYKWSIAQGVRPSTWWRITSVNSNGTINIQGNNNDVVEQLDNRYISIQRYANKF